MAILEYGDLIEDDGTFDDILESIEEIKKELQDLAKAGKKAFASMKPDDVEGIKKVDKELKDLEKTQKNLVKTEKVMQKAKKKSIDLTNEELIQIQKEKLAQRERVQIAKQQAVLQKKNVGEIEKLRAKLSLTTLQWKKLTKEELENTKKGKTLIATKKKLTTQLKKFEKATGDARRNVGNYSSSLGKLGKIAARVFVGRTIVDGLRAISGGVVDLIDKNKDANSTLGELGDAFSGVGGALTNAAVQILTFVAPAFTFLANTIKSVTEFFFGAADANKEFVATSDELKEVTEGLNKEFVKESSELAIVFAQLAQTNEGTKERKALIDQVNEVYGKYLPNLLTEKSTLQDIAKAQELATSALSKSFTAKIQNALLEDVVTNKINTQIAAFRNLQGRAKAVNKTLGSELLPQLQSLAKVFNDVSGEGFLARKILTSSGGSARTYKAALEATNPELLKFVKQLRTLGKTDSTALLLKQLSKNTSLFDGVINDTQASITAINNSIVTYDHSVSTNTSTITKNTKAIKDNREERLKAIEAVQKQLLEAETNNEIAAIKDKQERLQALEDLRFKEEQAIRKEQFEEDKELLKGHADELLALQEFNDGLSEQQVRTHEQKKADIRQEFHDARIAAAKKAVKTAQDLAKKQADADNKLIADSIKAGQESVNADAKQLQEKRKEELKSLAESKAANEKLISDISKSAQKVGAIIVNLFEKQADLSKKSVGEQEQNLSRARDRASKGLESNLVFEEQQLSKRQSEQQTRQKEAEQAARILTLFNLVSSYAASGDTNALGRGLVDFAFLTALSAGFEEGGFTGSDSSNSTAKGIVHANEYVVTAKDTARFGLTGKTGTEFGEAMGDYFNPQSPLTQLPYNDQKEAFKKGVAVTGGGSSNVVNAIKNLEKQISRQPNYSAQIVKAQEETHKMIIREVKRGMTKVYTKVIRASK